MPDDEMVRLTDLPRAIMETTGNEAPSYWTLHQFAVNARIPAERIGAGRNWYVRRSDIPAVCAMIERAQRRNRSQAGRSGWHTASASVA